MGTRGVIFLVAIVGLLFIAPIDAQSSDPANPTLTVAAFDLAPWAESDEAGRVHGITFDFFNAITERSGISFKLIKVPYKRMLGMLEYGEADASIFFRSPVSEQISDQLAMVHIVETIIIGLKGTDIHTFDDLADLTIASPRGISYGERFDQDQTLTKVSTNNHQQSIKMLLNDRVDTVAGPITSLYYTFNRAGISKTELGTALTIGQKQAWLQVSRNFTDPVIRRKLTAAVHALRTEGVFKNILNKYFN